MPITTPDFTTYQTVGYPSIATIQDISVGSDVLVTERRVTVVNSLGEYVVPDGTLTNYVVWPIADDTIDLDILDQDSALDITVLWVDSGGVTLYSKTLLRGFTLYNNTFLYSLTQAEASQSTPPNILQDTQYLQNKAALQIFIDSGNQAITYGSDIVSAQNMYDAASYMVENQSNFF